MPINWSVVTLTHVQNACDLYDAGTEVPRRAAKSTFLNFRGKTYPAKFIRGLAYRLATGIELDPNTDYAGGEETSRFFSMLGLATSSLGAPAASLPPSPPPPPTPVAAPAAPTPRARTYEPQKQALYDLLCKRFGSVDCEVKFPWLVVPTRDGMQEPLSIIWEALHTMRGFDNFAVPKQSLRCDFVIPSEKLIVEYDERQHFTSPRAIALDLYPRDLTLGFNREEWIKACRTINATDPSPPHRDEQRAFYDSLRDILAAENGYRLIRFRQGEFDWTGHDAGAKLAEAIPTSSSTADSARVVSPATSISRIALVAHDYTIEDSRGLYDYSEHFSRINQICDEQGCDTILYALYTWDANSTVPRTHDSFFGGLKHVQRIVVEVYQPPESPEHVEVWTRDQKQPRIVHQRFATSSASNTEKQQFLDELPSRQLADGLLVICGETNIASLVRGSDEFYDPYEFSEKLRDSGCRVILNPIHDYMRRYEMREKRRYYSEGGRTVISVWNQGKGKEAWMPWTVFRDREELTDCVVAIEMAIPERPDIRIGVLDLEPG